MSEATTRTAASGSAWKWIPTLYFAEGIPYVMVMSVSVIMYKRLGISNSDIALYTSWLYLPWVIKPLWSPFVDILRTKRFWIITMQLLIGAGLAGVALTIPASRFLQLTLAFFWLLAFSSATHDIAADGFYMLGLSKHDQAWFVGIRSTFYRLAMITGQGLLIILAGYIESSTGLPTVDIQVQAQPSAAVAVPIHPDSIVVAQQEGPLRLIASSETVAIDLARRTPEEIKALLESARAWNQEQGFYAATASTSSDEAGPEGPSWWQRNVVEPLETTLTNLFGQERAEVQSDVQVGNAGVVFFTLSGPVPAGENVVVNFGRESGDTSIQLVEGDRFTFTEANWNRPLMAVIQLDPKLDASSQALFRARSGNIPLAWSITFYVLAAMFILFCVYHRFVLPRPASDAPQVQKKVSDVFRSFLDTFVSFFKKQHIVSALGFLLLFRFAEAQLIKLASPFLLDAREVGGLALTTGEVGIVYGTVGVLMLTLGGILGGVLAARHGLKYWLWWMVIAINLPDAVYIFLSHALPSSLVAVNIAVGVEQFGYGFGFTAYMLFMIYVSEGEHKTAHFAICTGFMALGMMLPGMISGWLQEILGYQHFFVWVVIATIPCFIVTALVKIDPEFGKKQTEEA